MTDELFARFPDMRPANRPTLANWFGTGTMLVGRRGFDEDTNTYVKTLYLTLVFLPLIPLAAYRVATAPRGGWYLVGRVPVSAGAKRGGLAAVLLLVMAAGGGGLYWYTTTPEYVAAGMVEKADADAANGKPADAAKALRAVLDGKTPSVGPATEKLRGLIADPPPPSSDAPGIYAVAVDLHRQNRCPVPNLYAAGAAAAAKAGGNDPAAALGVLELIAPFAPDAAAALAAREPYLEKLVAANPTDAATASKLAAVYESTNRREKCDALLTPHEGRLGTLDGAAILARLRAAKGQTGKAYALLKPYVDGRLPSFLRAEESLEAVGKAAQDRVFQQLKSGNAPGFDVNAYDKLAKPKQTAMVQDYVNNALKDDPAISTARRAVAAESAVVPAVLDLGLLELEQGQAAADPAARKALLEAAEKTFLSVREVAGESDAYRMHLGQVYYWLGKPADGKKLFDTLLADRGRPANVMLQVAQVLREVGALTDARKLAEEAYENAKEPQIKAAAAETRALMYTDIDDDIKWLERGETANPNVQASLAYARGNKAIKEGQDDAAAGHFRRAVGIYDTMPESTSTLNNSALVHFEVFHLTHDAAEFARGADKLDRAVALKPSDTILLYNAATVLQESAIRDVIGTAVDLRAANRSARWDVLPFLYSDPAGRAAVLEKVSRHPALAKARGYFDKLLLLSPKRGDGYAFLAALHGVTRDTAALKALRDRVATADLDTATEEAEFREYVAGTRDGKMGGDARNATDRAEKSLAAARPVGGKTFAVAAAGVVRAKAAGYYFGEKLDAPGMVQLAREAHAAAPSDGTRSLLVTAYGVRAHLSLVAANPAYAAAAAKTKRTVGMGILNLVLAGPDSPVRAAAEADPAVKEWAAALLESHTALPDESSPVTWAALRGPHPAAAAAVAKADHARGVLRREVDAKLAPYTSTLTVERALTLYMAGDAAAAKAALADGGIVVP